ncbi:MAG: TonB-dependent siderophore receptor [Chromatocurvus sp.]
MSSRPTSHSRYFQSLLTSTALVSAGAVSTGASAQVAVQQANQGTIEEIVVRGVARKFRPEEQNSATGLNMALIDTPQAVTVITPEMMNTINANSAYEATDMVPGVQRSGFGFGFEQIVMRGIFNNTHRVNNILLGNNLTSIDGYAAERLEIVRGPATVLYGVTGSFGGEINSILKKPLRTPRMEVAVEAGNYDTQNYSIDIGGPLNDAGTLSGRVVAKYDEFDLPLDIKGEDFPNYQFMGMATVAWDITPVTTLRATHFHQDRNMDPWDGGALIENPDGSLALPDVDPEQWYFSHPDQSNETLDMQFSIIELEHQLANGWNSTTQLAWNKYDEDLSYFYPFGPFGAYSLGDDEIYIYTYDIQRDGEELTLRQSLGGDFDMFGKNHEFFFAAEYSDNQSPDRFELLNSAFQGFGTIDMYGAGYDGQPRFADGSEFNPIDGSRRDRFGVRQELLNETEDLLISAQVLLNPTERLQVMLGMLYQKNNTVTTVPINAGEVSNPPVVTNVGFEEQVYRFGATYDIADNWGFIDDARLYYSYSEGFEPQTFNDPDGNTVSAPQEMEQHEIGLKTEMFDGAVATSLALYDYEITNIQVSSAFLGSFGGFGSTVLEGLQAATGLEAEIIGEILPGWNVSANYAWSDIDIVDPNSGTAPPRTVPEHSGAIITTYEFLEGGMAGLRIGATLKISGDYSFLDGPTNVGRFGALEAGAHERLDLHASYAPRAGQLQNFQFYANFNNVFDEDILVAKQGNPGYGIMFIDQQRMTVGLRYILE